MIKGGQMAGFGMAWLAWLLIGGCHGQNDSVVKNVDNQENISVDPSETPALTFDTLAHDFGTILEGERVVCYFDYENSGGGSLMINDIETTCGCTIPDWSREPLAPGERNTLQIVFDATRRSGLQLKQVTVYSNAENSKVQLMIRANVKSNV
ncbi:MAG: DUF1573 domain-containing protein [Bacteroidales bacterium]